MASMRFASCNCHSGADLLLSKRFLETQHAAPAIGTGPVSEGEQETVFFRFLWFLKFSEALRDGAERGLQYLFCVLIPRQDKLHLNLFCQVQPITLINCGYC